MRIHSGFAAIVTGLLSAGFAVAGELEGRGIPWKLHTIDDSSRGADGVWVADVNGDGLADLTTGWEEGGRIRVYLNPGPKGAAAPWPAVTVGEVRSPEDAVFVDLDADGAIDVVSSCEGNEQTLYVHWAPKEREKYLDPAAWRTEPLSRMRKSQRWMFCLPLQLDGREGIDLVAGSKGSGAEIGWFEAPEDPRDLRAWRWHPIYRAGWIMSLFAEDVDSDGDLDILTTDRKGANRGCWWLKNPGAGKQQGGLWKHHLVGGRDREVMFMQVADVDGDGRRDIVSAVKGSGLLLFRRLEGDAPRWSEQEIPLPERTGTGKGVAVADLDLDGRSDLVFTCEGAKEVSGVVWLRQRWSEEGDALRWIPHEVSGTERGIKFDRIELLDLDWDGDLDVVTCEERDNLGVIWYENPSR